MIIMALAHARASGDGSLIGDYVRLLSSILRVLARHIVQYGLFQKWTEYLLDDHNALTPTNQ